MRGGWFASTWACRPFSMDDMNFQDTIIALQRFWAEKGCVIVQPYDMQLGAGTFCPATFFSVLGPKPAKVGYVQACRRPTDGRYGENPNRLGHYFQFQVILKPPPKNIQDMYLDSLRAMGLEPKEHDVRLIHDDWESPTLGAAGVGWQVWSDGQEITQFTYFQQIGGIELNPPSVELTYGLERICASIQGVKSVYDLDWSDGAKYGDLYLDRERQFSKFSFEAASVESLRQLFDLYEAECLRLLDGKLEQPAYDFCIACSHVFNLLDARSAISVAERVAYIARVRKMAKGCASVYCEHLANGAL